MSEIEYTIWRVVLIVAPWLVAGAVGTYVGDAEMAQLAPILFLMYLAFLWRVRRRHVLWRIAYVSRLPMLGIRLLSNRRWRTTFCIAPDPVLVGSQLVWLDRDLVDEERARLPRITAALAIVASLAPGRYARYLRISPTLVVARVPMVAGFMAGVNVLVLDIDSLRESPEVIASIIVHELCHAQLYSRGMTHQFFEQWHEHLASRDQAVFATHLLHAGREADARRVLQLARLSRNADTSLRARLRRFRENEKRRESVAASRVHP